MTQAPAYAEMSKTDLIGIIETQQKIIQRIYRIMPLKNNTFATGEKLTWIVAQPLIAQEKPNAKGLVRLPIAEVAEQIGMSSETVGRYIKNMCERCDATHEVEPYTTKSGQKCNLVFIDPTEPLWTAPEAIEPEPEQLRTINGNICPRCKSNDYHVKKRSIASQDIGRCDACNLLKVYPVVEDNAPLAPGDYILEGPQAEKPRLLEGPQAENLSTEASNFHDVVKIEGSQPGDLSNHQDKPENLSELFVSTESVVVGPPQELAALPIWVCWRYQMVKGKPTKVPYNAKPGANNAKAKSNDAATWTSYDEAQAVYEASQAWKLSYDGIGFMCTGEFTGVDLDHCRDKETGEISQEAQTIIDSMASYTEITPSETGVRIIARGSIPYGTKQSGIEMYCERRFFTWTGKQLAGTPRAIYDRQAELDGLLAVISPKKEKRPARAGVSVPCNLSYEEILDRARGAKSGAKFEALWEGKWEGLLNEEGKPYASQSEADMALCSLIKQQTSDASMIDRLFRQSGLYREEKWDRAARVGETYGEGTIRMVLTPEEEAPEPLKEPLTPDYLADVPVRQGPLNMDEYLAEQARKEREQLRLMQVSPRRRASRQEVQR